LSAAPNFSNSGAAVANALADALAHQAAARYEAAAVALRQVLALAPNHSEAMSRLGWVLNEAGYVDEAIAAHRETVAAHPNLAHAWSNFAVALQGMGEQDEALQALLRAVALDPTLPEAQVNLGLQWQLRGRVVDAVGCFQQAIARQPMLVEAWINLALSLQSAREVDIALAALGQALALHADNASAWSNTLMTLQYSAVPTLDLLRQRAQAAAKSIVTTAPQDFVAPIPATARVGVDRRLRVGYVSADFYAHPIGWMAVPAILAHDRSKIEVHCFADVYVDDDITSKMREGVEHWHDARTLSHGALLALIAKIGIDVLIDLSGHTAHNRLPVFAARAAPVQLSWLGYAASTGLDTIDGVLLGDAMAPPGAQDAFVEPLRKLPRCHFTYQPPSYAPAIAECPESTRGYVTFGSFNNPAKAGEDVFAAWAAILFGTPNSRLVLKWRSLADAAVRAHIERAFALHGIDSTRLDLREASPHPTMLAQYGDIDIALDPFPFCGGLTSCEALWMGVPVVTLPWLRPMSRQGLALLNMIGLESLVATTPRQYIDIATALAADHARRKELRATLRARVQASLLFDADGLARALESQYLSLSLEHQAQ